MKIPRFVIFKDKAGQWRFNLKARNGKIIAVSEGYISKQGAVKGAVSVMESVHEMVLESGQPGFVQKYITEEDE